MRNRDHLFVTDLDGTLLGADSRVSSESARIISELSHRGAMITVATARTPGTVEPLLSHTFTVPPAIVLTGAAMWDRSRYNYLSMITLPPAEACMVYETARRCGLSPLVYKRAADNRHLAFYFNPQELSHDGRRFVDDRSALQLKTAMPVTDPGKLAATPDTVLILAMGPGENVDAAVKALVGRPGMSVSSYSDPVYPSVSFLEVFGAGVSKAHQLKLLREMTGARHVTVFGDSANDLSMLEVADRAIAVDNADEVVKRAFHDVIGPNTADSVARYIAAESGMAL